MDAVVQPSPTEAPQAAPAGETHMSLREFRQQRDTPEKTPAVAKPTETPSVEKVTAKAEPEDDDDDPEVAAEIDKAEAPKPEETPEERRARRNRHRKAVQRGLKTRFRNERDDARRRISELERELQARTAVPAPVPAQETAQPKAEPAASATRPKPTQKDFPLEKFAHEDDPYVAQAAALAEAIADWRWEQHTAAERASRQRAEAERTASEVVKAHEARIPEAQARYPDFDAIVSGATFPATPQAADLFEMVLQSPLSADLAYYLSHPQNRDEVTRLLASRSRVELVDGLAEIKATVKASLKAAEKPAATPKVQASPEPVQPVTAGAASGALLRNPFQDGGTQVNLRTLRSYREASAR